MSVDTAPYEFTEEQNATIRMLARRMKFVGLLLIFLGVLLGIFCAFTIVRQPLLGTSYLLQTVLVVTFGFWTNSASYAFRMIVETTGNDIHHLMDAVSSLRKLYTLQFWLVLLIVAMILLTIVVAVWLLLQQPHTVHPTVFVQF